MKLKNQDDSIFSRYYAIIFKLAIKFKNYVRVSISNEMVVIKTMQLATLMFTEFYIKYPIFNKSRISFLMYFSIEHRRDDILTKLKRKLQRGLIRFLVSLLGTFYDISSFTLFIFCLPFLWKTLKACLDGYNLQSYQSNCLILFLSNFYWSMFNN